MGAEMVKERKIALVSTYLASRSHMRTFYRKLGIRIWAHPFQCSHTKKICSKFDLIFNLIFLQKFNLLQFIF